VPCFHVSLESTQRHQQNPFLLRDLTHPLHRPYLRVEVEALRVEEEDHLDGAGWVLDGQEVEDLDGHLEDSLGLDTTWELAMEMAAFAWQENHPLPSLEIAAKPYIGWRSWRTITSSTEPLKLSLTP
jgi:hypothetical protein